MARAIDVKCNHGRGPVASEGDLVSMKPIAQRSTKSFWHSVSQRYGLRRMESQKDSVDHVFVSEEPSDPLASWAKVHRKKRWEESSLSLKHRALLANSLGLYLLRLSHLRDGSGERATQKSSPWEGAFSSKWSKMLPKSKADPEGVQYQADRRRP